MVGKPSLEFSVLGSGSAGNCVLVRGGNTCLLVDAGLNLKEVRRRMRALGLAPESVDALLITHEHGDHVAHASRVAMRLSAPIYLTDGTRNALSPKILRGNEELVPIRGEGTFRVGDLEVEAVKRPHDAADPVSFLVTFAGSTMGVFTDLGHVDRATGEAIQRCHGVVMESNHDPALLARGPYPAALRRRVGGHLGHISNDDSARALCRWATNKIGVLVLAHVSSRNNTMGMVRAASVRHLGEAPGFPRWLSGQRHPTPLLKTSGEVVRKPNLCPVPSA